MSVAFLFKDKGLLGAMAVLIAKGMLKV